MVVKRIILGLAIILVVVLVILGAGYYLLVRNIPQPVPPAITPSPTLTATPDMPNPTPSPIPTPTPRISVEPTPTPQKEKVTIELTEEQVNAKLKELMVQYKDKLPLPTENPVIHLRPGKVEVEADVILAGAKVKVWGEGRVEIEQGKPKIVVDKVKVGDLPLPPAFQQRITSLIPSSAILPIDIPIEVTSITVLEGKVVIEGIPK